MINVRLTFIIQNVKQCKKIGDVVYATNWYYLPNKDMLKLILIISRSNSTIKITAGKMTHMCINTFGDCGNHKITKV
ncbi:hypothetical protein E2986_11719 [Frieseomelitta varia]|uniref:Uncharacterized protein n=1 Tax=Frieseomelitta varia TaxID=561572 RepID=A0A833S4N1_9HYME|nr:hypothetical protein E2986_11719 [Frieseomelitta varia]